jgi:serine/threonine protein kinase
MELRPAALYHPSVERTSEGPPAVESTPQAGTPSCVACGSALDAPRCGQCGATAAAGGFRVAKVLHEGSHSRVYLAQGADGRRVVLKEMLFARAPDAKTLDDFAREGELLRQLDHPAIPRFVASFTEGTGSGTRLYLAQEHIEGTTLLARLGTHRFDAREAESLARDVLGVLAYLHGLSPPVLHRDLKPANLIVRPDGRLSLVDFGSAREIKPGGTHRATLTGTFGYLPPEALGGTVDQTADLYGLGATLLHLLTRRPPEETLWDDSMRLELQVQAPPAFVAWLGRLTARKRSERFASAAEALAALEGRGASALPRPPANAIATHPRHIGRGVAGPRHIERGVAGPRQIERGVAGPLPTGEAESLGLRDRYWKGYPASAPPRVPGFVIIIAFFALLRLILQLMR